MAPLGTTARHGRTVRASNAVIGGSGESMSGNMVSFGEIRGG